MAAYVIFIRERTLDQSELDIYAKLARPSLEGLPIKFLAAYGRQEVLEAPRPRAWQSPNFRHWKRPSNGTRAPRIRQRHSIDLKARSIAASLLKALNSEGRAAFTYFCKLGKEAKCGIRAPQASVVGESSRADRAQRLRRAPDGFAWRNSDRPARTP